MKKWLQDHAPDARDIHIYGGLVALAAGINTGAYGWAALGAALFYLGVWRMR